MISIESNHADDDATTASSCQLARVDDHRPQVSDMPLSSFVAASPRVVLEFRFRRIPLFFRAATCESTIIKPRWSHGDGSRFGEESFPCDVDEIPMEFRKMDNSMTPTGI